MTEVVPIDAVRAWVWQCSGVTASQRLVLLALCEQLHRGHPCQCSLRELSTLVALTPRGLTKVLAGLDGRYLRRQSRGRGYPTQYALLCPALKATSTDRPSGADEGTGVDGAPHMFPPHGARATRPALAGPVPQFALPAPEDRTAAARAPTLPMKAQRLTLVGSCTSACASPSSDAALPSPPAPASRQHRARAGPISPAWTPGEAVYAWAQKRGLNRAWVQEQIEEFVIYWRDCGESRKSWDATFINRLQLLQSRISDRPTHETRPRLAAKDYAAGATPLDHIDWLRADDVA